jgi:hypothetical protein
MIAKIFFLIKEINYFNYTSSKLSLGMGPKKKLFGNVVWPRAKFYSAKTSPCLYL